jgi:acetolactate synthase-1/2/3 large subunit
MVENKIKVSDYISQTLSNYGIKYIYGIMGGGAAALNDSFITNRKLQYICFHHEQGACNAALAESKIKNNISVVNPTTGCGGGNCITSLISAYQDSIPLLFISGNFRLNQTSRFLNNKLEIKLRKIGLQEHDIISHVQGATKYSVFITNPEDIPYEINKAINICMSGRKGPCWIDIPADIQSAYITIPKFEESSIDYISNQDEYSKIDLKNLTLFKHLLLNSERPIVLAGYGIHLSDSRLEFVKFIESNSLPYVSTFLSKDLTDYDHPLYVGTIGIKGSRAGNFAIQKSDLLIILGCSLNSSHIGYDEKLFSPLSKKILVNIDKNDFMKNNVKIDLFFNNNIKDFFKYV